VFDPPLAIGTWHCGFAAWKYTPTFRGFDTFFGFYNGVEDYFKHTVARGYDMRHDVGPNCGRGCSKIVTAAKGTYSTNLFAARAVKVVEAHDVKASPLFLYLAFQGVHGPQEVPERYVKPYVGTSRRPNFSGMVSAVDEGVGNLTAALEAKGMLQTTLYVVTSDNGGPVGVYDAIGHNEEDAIGASNFPTRGGKHLLFEGGVRVTGFIHAPFIAGFSRYGNLFHASDWWPTFAELAGLGTSAPRGWKPLDGVSHLAALRAMRPEGTAAVPPPRETIVLDNQSTTYIDEYGVNVGIVHQGMKLILSTMNCGWSEPEPNDTPNGTTTNEPIPGPWLFDLVADPHERNDLAASHPTVVSGLTSLLRNLSADRYVWPIDRFPHGTPTNYSFGPVWEPWLPDEGMP
jgi:arylsulfatase B